MKVAVVFTGLLRNFEHAYPAFKEYFLDRYDCDVFFDIWSDVGWYTGKGYLPERDGGFVNIAEGDKGFHESGLVNVNRICELYNPVSLRIEDFSRFEPLAESKAGKFTNALTRPKNTVSQAYKVVRGIELMMEYKFHNGQQYDLVVRARPDITLEHDPGLFELGAFYTLPSKNKHGKGTGDSIQIGSYDNMIKFSFLYEELERLYDKIGYSCPHMFNEEWIKECGFKHKEMHIGAHVAHSPNAVPYAEPV